MSSLRTQSSGGVLGLSSVGSERTGAASSAAGSHSHRTHHHYRSRSRSAPRAPEKPPRKRTLNPGHSLASIPSQIRLSMLNSGLISIATEELDSGMSTTLPTAPTELSQFPKLCELRRKYPVLYRVEFQLLQKHAGWNFVYNC